MHYYLSVELLSDATFGRGSGVAGLVDVEIEQDNAGLPQIGGRTLKGLLVEEWANLRYALGSAGAAWDAEATWLFGRSGALNDGTAHMHLGAAQLPDDLRALLASSSIPAHEILESLTTIRTQTAVDAVSGAPEESSLRAMRALLRETRLIAPIAFDGAPMNRERVLGLLAACVKAVRRGGLGRNRGRGRLRMLLHGSAPTETLDVTFTDQALRAFTQEVLA